MEQSSGQLDEARRRDHGRRPACSTAGTASSAASVRAAWRASSWRRTWTCTARSRSRCSQDRYAEDAQFVERFAREARAAAGLNHPNIVADLRPRPGRRLVLHRDGVPRRGDPEGHHRPRGARCRSGARSTSRCRSSPPCASRTAARSIHRDVKPHNMMVLRDGRVKVADFGIARAGDSEMTEAGSIVGTAQYLSPEQARGQHGRAAEPTSTRSASCSTRCSPAGCRSRRLGRRDRDEARAGAAGAAAPAGALDPARPRDRRAARDGEGPVAPLPHRPTRWASTSTASARGSR